MEKVRNLGQRRKVSSPKRGGREQDVSSKMISYEDIIAKNITHRIKKLMKKERSPIGVNQTKRYD